MDFRGLCEDYLSRYGGRAFLTPSCTSALELSVLLSGVEPGDEVILPSFTFSSGANAVIRAGGVPVFVDIRRDTLNIDSSEAIAAITPRTKAIMPTHYAGVFSGVWSDAGFKIIEDAAQCIGDFELAGDFACFSFHKTKNVQCGEGGALLVKDPDLWDRANMLRNCGTTCFKEADWDWVEYGTHALMSEPSAEILWKGLQGVKTVTEQRRKIWGIYRHEIETREKATQRGNAHIFWFLCESRDEVIRRLGELGVRAVKHYTPLHSRVPGIKYGRTFGSCENATYVSQRIVRLPMDVTEERALEICSITNEVLYEQQGRSFRGIQSGGSEQGEAAGGAGHQREAA